MPFPGLSSHVLDSEGAEAPSSPALQSVNRLMTGSEIGCKQLSARYNPPRVLAPFRSLAFRPKHTGLICSPHQGSSITASPL